MKDIDYRHLRECLSEVTNLKNDLVKNRMYESGALCRDIESKLSRVCLEVRKEDSTEISTDVPGEVANVSPYIKASDVEVNGHPLSEGIDPDAKEVEVKLQDQPAFPKEGCFSPEGYPNIITNPVEWKYFTESASEIQKDKEMTLLYGFKKPDETWEEYLNRRMKEGRVPSSDEKPSTIYTVQVYIDDGRVFSYEVPSPDKVREHAAAIIKDGYRHNDGKTFEHYPSWRILKVKSSNIDTKYPDQVSGT